MGRGARRRLEVTRDKLTGSTVRFTYTWHAKELA